MGLQGIPRIPSGPMGPPIGSQMHPPWGPNGTHPGIPWNPAKNKENPLLITSGSPGSPSVLGVRRWTLWP